MAAAFHFSSGPPRCRIAHGRPRCWRWILDFLAPSCPPASQFCCLWLPFGPPLSAPSVRLPDGRHLAYKEFGVPRHSAAYKAVFVHGFNSSRHSAPPFSQAFLEAHHVYVVSFDRAGYGQSDPNPRRNLKSEAEDIERLADLLELGDTFYLIPESIGGYSGWSCLKYIPHRLAGVGMIAPVTNFWWPGISATEFKQAFATQILADRLLLRVAHYLPWLLYFWMSQPWIPASSAVNLRLEVLNASDRNVVEGFAHATEVQIAQMAEGLQQGIAETLCRDAKVMFSNWEFDPGDLENPYPDRPGCVHIWQGDEDYLVPVLLQRYIHRRLPWIQYHEIQGGGHLLKYHDGFPDSLLKTLLLGEKFEFRH